MVQQGGEEALQDKAHVPSMHECAQQPYHARALRRCRLNVPQRSRFLQRIQVSLQCSVSQFRLMVGDEARSCMP